jgi:[NiFe] hydrogenase diaphorase moiety large subunit
VNFLTVLLFIFVVNFLTLKELFFTINFKGMQTLIDKLIKKYNSDKTRLLDILLELYEEKGVLSSDDCALLAQKFNMSKAEICETASFYHFFIQKNSKYKIYLNNSVTAEINGRSCVAKAFEEACGTTFGNVSDDGLFGLYDTSCIGMNDQEPAAIINGIIFTQLSPFRVKELIKDLKEGKSLNESIFEGNGDGNNAHPLINSMVYNNIRRKGIILKNDYEPFDVLNNKLCSRSPEEIITIVEGSNIRGRGGAGFPTGLKWRFGRVTQGEHRILICNADEGEPGTFKDRVLLTEYAEQVFEGMLIAAYATGADIGVLYLRYEYKYLIKYLNNILEDMRSKGYLGTNIKGNDNFNFDIRIQLGAGAYVCGEESALIESMEGKRGEPRDKPPFPVEKGYLGYPTIVNNVETLAAVVKIIKNGAAWFDSYGTSDSAGTKILSISGDCKFPGIYEVEWGISIEEVLEMAGADDVQAIQVGGPSGILLGEKDFNHILSYSDLATGGSMIIFNKSRDLIKDVVLNFTEFFIEESCGSCSTCRIMPVVMKNKVEKILNGNGVKQDLDDILNWGKLLKISRCGLGQTAGNPILTSLKNFRKLYEKYISNKKEFDTGFNLDEAVTQFKSFVNHKHHF